MWRMGSFSVKNIELREEKIDFSEKSIKADNIKEFRTNKIKERIKRRENNKFNRIKF